MRTRVALGLLVGGGIALQLTSAYTLPLAIVGFTASVAGWVVVPARGWRRSLAVLPGVFGVAALLSGAGSAPLAAMTVAAWLLVRGRPAPSWVVLVLPIATGVVLGRVYTDYGAGVEIAVIVGITAIGSAWLGMLLNRTLDARRRTPTPRGPAAAGARPPSAQSE